MDKIELAWAAGFMDADGCFTFEVLPERPRAIAAQVIRDVDGDVPVVLERLLNAVGGIGEIERYKTPLKPRHRQQFFWRTTTFEEFQAVIAMLWDFLSPYKKECILDCLNRYHSKERNFRYSERVLEYNGPVIKRSEALGLDMDRYFTGKKCSNGHLSQRWVKSGKCLGCRYERRG